MPCALHAQGAPPGGGHDDAGATKPTVVPQAYALEIGLAYMERGSLAEAKGQLYRALGLSIDAHDASTLAAVQLAITKLQTAWLRESRQVMPAPVHDAAGLNAGRRRGTEPWQLAESFRIPPVVDWTSNAAHQEHPQKEITLSPGRASFLEFLASPRFDETYWETWCVHGGTRVGGTLAARRAATLGCDYSGARSAHSPECA